MNVYRGNWNDINDLMRDFEIIPPQFSDFKVLLAMYEYVCYEGQAFVLLLHRQENKLYEVNANHCSYDGLGGQWEPEETSIAALRYRVVNGSLGEIGGEPFGTDLLAILDVLEITVEEIDNSPVEHLVVVERLPNTGYFVGDEHLANFSPDFLPNVYLDTCRICEDNTIRKWVLEDMIYEENDELSISKKYTLNPELEEWRQEGENHTSNEVGRGGRGDDPDAVGVFISVYRERVVDCYRAAVSTVHVLATWLKDNNGHIVDGTKYNILEDKIIEVTKQG